MTDRNPGKSVPAREKIYSTAASAINVMTATIHSSCQVV